MGVWGAGLYSGDFAADLRGAVAAVARLPFDGSELVELLRQTKPTAANDPHDADHTVFWLIVADQFWKRGIASTAAKETALAIIDEEHDLKTMASLGLAGPALRARGRVLGELRARLTGPAPAVKPRKVLNKPQPFLFETGEAFVFPTSRGDCINPYFPSKEAITGGWRQDGWGAAVIVETGRTFDFLAWHRPTTASAAIDQRPTLDVLRARPDWRLARPGTTTRRHVEKMEIERLGVLPIDPEKLDRLFPKRPSGRSAAVSDISIANALHLPVKGDRYSERLMGRPQATIPRLDDILRD